MSFEYPWVLLALILLPIFAWWLVQNEDRQTGFGFPSLRALSGFAMDGGRLLQRLPLILRLLVLACLIGAAARPLGGEETSKRNAEGLDIVLAIDTSQSMLAMDFELNGERQNRLEVVKSVLEDFIAKRLDDRIGLVVFGSQAFTQSPLTMDHKALLQYLKHISIGMAGPETAIGDGLGTAIKRIKDVPATSKIIILLTDGENTAGQLDPLEAARLAKTLGIRIYTVGVGSNEPVPFPVQGFWGVEYRPQIIRYNGEELEKIAVETNAKYFSAKDTESLKRIYETIDSLEKSRQEWDEPVRREERAWFFLWLALAFLLCEQLWLLTPWRVIP